MTKRLWIAALILFMIPAMAEARKYTHPVGASINIPGNWDVETDEETLTATSPDETCVLTMMVLDAADMDEALDGLDEALAEDFDNLQMKGEPSEINLNGMRAVTADASGTSDGVDLELGIMIVQVKPGKILLVFGVVAKQTAAKHEAAVGKMLRSIKRG